MTMPARGEVIGQCPGCGAPPGEDHDGPDCDHAQCPGCGQQLFMHDGECGRHDGRPARWHGTDQRGAVARELGWWTTVPGIDHPVEDTTRVIIADALGMITWNRDTQTYIIGHVNEAELDAQLAGNGAW